MYVAYVRGCVETETLDDLTATERAARTHPDAPPHLPPLPFADHAEEMASIMYAPELIGKEHLSLLDSHAPPSPIYTVQHDPISLTVASLLLRSIDS